jgi:hypothetical protein
MDAMHMRMACWMMGLGVLLLGPVDATGQATGTATVRLSADSAKVGERLTLTLIAEHGPGTEALFPGPADGQALFGPLRVIRRTGVSGNGRIDSVRYEVTPFALDSARVPPLPVQLARGPDTTTLRTAPRTLSIKTVLPADTSALRGLAPLAAFPRPWWHWGLVGLVGAGLLAGGLYAWWQRRTEPEEPGPSPVPAAPGQTSYEAAIRRLRQLEAYDLADPDAVPPFYVELADILRTVLVRELGVAAFEHTTREVVDRLADRPDVPPKAVQRLKAVLELADLVKFADMRPTPADGDKALREARAALDAIESGTDAPVPDIDVASAST